MKAHRIKLTVVSCLYIFCPPKIRPVSLTNDRISGIIFSCFSSSLLPDGEVTTEFYALLPA